MRVFSMTIAHGLLGASLAVLVLAAAPASGATGVERRASTDAGLDIELWLRSCPGAGLRNAKLYAARALGIELMKRSADRNQARSTLDIDRQLVPMLDQLRKRGLPDTELQQMEDAVMGLTELTVQNPVVSQIDSVVRMAEGVAGACQRAADRQGIGSTGAPINALQQHMSNMLSVSQRLAMEHLASAADTRQRAPAAEAYVAQMDNLLTAIRKASADNQAMLNTHALLEGQWFFLKRAVQRPPSSGRQPVEDVGRTSEIMFEVLEAELRRLSRNLGA